MMKNRRLEILCWSEKIVYEVEREEEAKEPHVHAIGVFFGGYENCDLNGQNMKLTQFWMTVMWLRGELLVFNLLLFLYFSWLDF